MKVGPTLAAFILGMLLLLPSHALAQAQSPESDGPLTENPKYNKQVPPPNTPLPHSENESSSEQTRLDISTPEDDLKAHPNEAKTASGKVQKHPWNPLRAMKDVEVGDYYYRDGNYKAAISRYREALDYKPRDAEATFKLAQALEKSKQLDEARTNYEAYLAILKDGPRAAEARKALERLKK